jgi:hypothetical protein
MNQLTQQGITALRAGNKAEARQFFKQAIQIDAKDAHAWLWLAAAVDTDREKINCLQMVLRLEPDNPSARNELARLSPRAATPVPGPAPVRPSASSAVPSSPLKAQRPLITPPPVIPPPPFVNQPPNPVAAQTATPLDSWREQLGVSKTPEPVVPEPLPPLSPPPPTPPPPATVPKSKPGTPPWMWAILVILLALVGVTIYGIIALSNQSKGDPAAPPLVTPFILPTRTITPAAFQTPLPSQTFTPAKTLPPTQTSTITPRPTRTPTATGTYMVFGPTLVKQMANIRQEVSDLRGLPIKANVPSYIITKLQAEDLLRNIYNTSDMIAEMENEKRGLVVLGLMKPTYDMINITMNHIVDNIGGFFLHTNRQIYILASTGFGGIEHWVYSHEFDHAIVDQTYDIVKMQECPNDEQRCTAVKALIEGDASLLMDQWVKQYATPQDYRDFLFYIENPPYFIAPEQFSPPYIGLDVDFPYDQGYTFVKYLYKRGNWAEVNRAYANPPTSTEQILHPEKYLAHENPIPVSGPPLEPALGGDWKLLTNSSLGEWTTFLILGYNADVASQISDTIAAPAAAGWGGDRYQVYYSPSLDQTALAVHWVWDTKRDGTEFESALKKQLGNRFRGNTIAQTGATCWESVAQTSCFISRPSHTLWLIAPDMPTLLKMWAQYPEFQ